MTESTELLAFKRQKDGHKATVNIYCVLATMKYTWCAYWSPPFTIINY